MGMGTESRRPFTQESVGVEERMRSGDVHWLATGKASGLKNV